MVITCPSCSARYRLNPDKIKGRGAKITCPKCSHVFVVFADATTSSDGTPAAPPPHAAPQAADPPTAGHNPETTSGAFQAVGFGEDEVTSSTTGNIRVVAPGPRKTRRVRALSRDNIPTTKQIGGGPDEVEAGADEAPPEPVVEPRTAADLDFRSVGITTWKVKVSIGLIYDFSDISTLKKYLADKKVTEDDLISHNAKEWTRIGEIPDLDQHFIETWKAAKAAGASAAPKKERKPDPAATGSNSTAGTGSYGTSSGTYGAQPGQATGSHRTTSSQPPARRTKKKAAPPPEETSNRGKFIALAAVLLLAVGGGWMYFQSQETPTPVAGGEAPSVDTPEAEASQQERIKEAIQRKLENERAEIEARLDAEAAAEAEAEKAAADELPIAERNLVPVRPGDQGSGDRGTQPRKLQKINQRNTTPRRDTSTAEATAGASRSTTKKTSALTWLTVARKKLQDGNYGSALKAANNAVSADRKCGECYSTRAEIKQKMGDPAGASEDLAKASELGSGSQAVQ
jgi:predicted Zn finger-like uncharacterized protein